jgi:hypothetical protein
VNPTISQEIQTLRVWIWQVWSLPWVTLAKFLFLLVPAGVFSAWLGFQDVDSALTFGGRVEGAITVFVSVALLSSAVCVIAFQLHGTNVAGTVAFLGCLVASLFGATLLLVQLLAGDRSWLDAVWVAMVVAGLWATLRIWRAGVKIPLPKSIAVAIVLPTLFTAGNFIYSDVYKPSVQPNQVSISADLGSATVSADGRRAEIPIDIDFKNVGQHEVTILSTSYSVVGRVVQPANNKLSDTKSKSLLRQRQLFMQDTSISSYVLLQSGQFLSPGTFFEAGDEHMVSLIAEVNLPTGFDELAIDAQAAIVGRDRATVVPDLAIRDQWTDSWNDSLQHVADTPAWVAGRGTDYVRLQSPIKEGSRLHGLVRTKHLVTVWWVLASPSIEDPAGPFLTATIAPPGGESRRPSAADYESMYQRYGLEVDDSGVIERSVVAIKLPSK